MNETTHPSPTTSRGVAVVALVLIGISFLWYLGQVVKFGFNLDMVDLIGAYFVLSGIAVAVVLRGEGNRMRQDGFLFLACALAMPATALFLGQFLSTFDPFYRVGGRLFPYLLRGLFLGAAATTLIALGPRRFFRFPKWLLVLTCVVVVGWLFVYACPSIVREWYGTRTEPSELFPEGMLTFDRPNPERGIQSQMLFASAVALGVAIVVGRVRYRRASRPADSRSSVVRGQSFTVHEERRPR